MFVPNLSLCLVMFIWVNLFNNERVVFLLTAHSIEVRNTTVNSIISWLNSFDRSFFLWPIFTERWLVFWFTNLFNKGVSMPSSFFGLTSGLSFVQFRWIRLYTLTSISQPFIWIAFFEFLTAINRYIVSSTSHFKQFIFA